jgi:anti-anti-sigma factor
MEIEALKQQDALVLRPKGHMETATAAEFEQECLKWIEKGEKLLLIDMVGLEYISSAGLRSILYAAKQLKAKQGQIRFCNLSGVVQEVFSISGFTSMFSIYDTYEDALNAS